MSRCNPAVPAVSHAPASASWRAATCEMLTHISHLHRIHRIPDRLAQPMLLSNTIFSGVPFSNWSQLYWHALNCSRGKRLSKLPRSKHEGMKSWFCRGATCDRTGCCVKMRCAGIEVSRGHTRQHGFSATLALFEGDDLVLGSGCSLCRACRSRPYCF